MKTTSLQFHDGTEWHIWADGTQYWYLHRMLHRESDKPAAIYADGTQLWYHNGKRHREGDKPAVIDSWGTQHWYLNGEYLKSK